MALTCVLLCGCAGNPITPGITKTVPMEELGTAQAEALPPPEAVPPPPEVQAPPPEAVPPPPEVQAPPPEAVPPAPEVQAPPPEAVPPPPEVQAPPPEAIPPAPEVQAPPPEAVAPPPEVQSAPPGLDIASVSPATRMSYQELVGDNGDHTELSPDKLPPAGTYFVQIDTTNKIVKVFDQQGNVVRLMLCTTGAKETPTPPGSFSMGSQRRRFGYFEEFECYAQYWTQINGDIFFHSVLYDEKNAATLIGSSYRNLGNATSHGCVRLSVPDARWVYENLAPTTKCEIAEHPKDKALKAQLRLPKK